MPLEIRTLDRSGDRAAIEALDTGFETDAIFDVVTRERGIELIERRLPSALTKRYSIGEVFAPWASWKRGWCAVDGKVRAFAAVEHEPWHQRLVLWFLYVDRGWRQQGVGRALLEQVEAYGKQVQATHVWLETSNVNLPGVHAYQRLGYQLCGVDTLYYGSYMPGESALYLAKMIA